MYRMAVKTIANLLLPMSLMIGDATIAATHPYEFHADARMQHDQLGPIDNAYGYTIVATDADGNGSINVMFSNGSDLDGLRFNARVKFYDAGGELILEEYFESWIDAAGFRDPVESKQTRPLATADFDSVEVDFFVTEVPADYPTAIVDIGFPLANLEN